MSGIDQSLRGRMCRVAFSYMDWRGHVRFRQMHGVYLGYTPLRDMQRFSLAPILGEVEVPWSSIVSCHYSASPRPRLPEIAR